MPLTEKGEEILGNMKKTYGSEKKAKQVFYASKNAGKISGVDRAMSRDRSTIKRFIDAAAASGKVKFPPSPSGATAYERSIYDRLPTRDAFCKCVRDAVRAGEPLPKVLQFGNTWGTGKGGHDTWQMQDKARVRRRFLDAVRRGFGTRDAIRIADADMVAGTMKIGETSGKGQPMAGPDPEPPDGEDRKSRHFFKGAAKDAVAKLVRDYGVQGMKKGVQNSTPSAGGGGMKTHTVYAQHMHSSQRVQRAYQAHSPEHAVQQATRELAHSDYYPTHAREGAPTSKVLGEGSRSRDERRLVPRRAI